MLWQLIIRCCAFTDQRYIDIVDCVIGHTIAMLHVGQLVRQDKPEIIDAVIAQRHHYHWVGVIQPKARTVDLRSLKMFDNEEFNTVIRHYSGYLSYLFSVFS